MRSLDEEGSNIYSAVFLTALKLFSGPDAPRGRKAIILLTDGQDSGLKLTWDPASMFPPDNNANWLTFEDMVRQLSSAGVEVFAISTENRPERMTPEWLAAQRGPTLISRQSQADWRACLHNLSSGTGAARWAAIFIFCARSEI